MRDKQSEIMEKTAKILYIDDEEYNLTLLSKIFKNTKYDLLIATDGLEGIDIAQVNKLDLIILDINMAGMNGYEIATRLKAIDSLRDVPLIALTANSTMKSRDMALISGCDGFIKKPIIPDKITFEINEYINGKRESIERDRQIELMKQYNLELVEHLEKEIRDLRHANTDLRDLDKLKSDFITIASHELRTPLVTIVGYIGLLMSKRISPLTPEVEKMLKVVERNISKLQNRVQDMLTISYIEKKVPFLKLRSVTPINIAENILEDNALVLAERMLAAKLHIRGDIPEIECDPEKIEQVISNVFNNAIKYTEDFGMIELSICYPSTKINDRYELDPEKYVDILIEDNGIGVPRDKLEKIFGKFIELTNVDMHHSSDHEFMGCGSGLGLSISRGIIESHCGFIWADNREPKGTSIVIVLPKIIENKRAFVNIDSKDFISFIEGSF